MVDADSVRAHVTEPLPGALLTLGAYVADGVAHVPFSSKTELAATLTAFQKAGFYFGNEPAGWPPAAVFQQLRDVGLVSGPINSVSWKYPNEPIFDEI